MTNQIKPALPVRTWRYLQRHGVKRLLRRVRDELRPSSGSRDHSKLPSSGISEIQPAQIYAHLDSPADGAIESSSILLLRGWACAGDRIATVRTFVDGVAVGSVRHGLARPDVATYLPRVPGAGSSGFTGEVEVRDLDSGEHLLELVVDDLAGNRRVIKSVVVKVPDAELYSAYYDADQPTSMDVAELHRRIRRGGTVPIDLWVRASSGDGSEQLKATLESIAEQSYREWRCRVFLVGGRGSSEPLPLPIDTVDEALRDRFEVVNPESLGQFEAQAGVYCGFLAAGEVIGRHGLLRLAARLSTEHPDICYSDHDAIDAAGDHVQPWLNPDWSPDYLLARNYVGGFYLFKDELRPTAIDMSGDLSAPAWRYELLLALSEKAVKIDHEPHLLWSRPQRTLNEAGVMNDAELSAAQAAAIRRQSGSSAEATDNSGLRRIHWPVVGEPRVSIIVPTTGKMAYVEPLIRSLSTTSYKNYELIAIDNSRGRNQDGIQLLRDNGARVLERDEDFNWAKLNNDGAAEANGELLLFLNDDIEIIDPDWLTELVSQAQRPEIGAVGALLLYPDRRIQHGGVFFVGYGGGAVHLFQGIDPAYGTYLDLHRTQREVSAVTGACLMVRRGVFDDVGRFDERLAIAGNDVDLCLRLMKRGLRNIWTPYAVLLHHESASRRDASITPDETTMWQIWGDFLRAGDPFHSPHFAKDRVDCALDASRVGFLGHAPTHPAGVNLVGYIRAEMGLGQAARGVAAALKAVGEPFSVIDYQYGNPSRMEDATWAAFETEKATYDVNVVYVNADLVPEAFPRLPAGTLDGRYTIGAWTWELPEFPDEWVPSFEHVDEVWVPSTFVQQAIAAKSPVPVVRMPHAISRPGGPFASRADLGLAQEPFLFLMMYDYFSVRRRKNPEGAIEAFRHAFDAEDRSVELVIKMNNVDRTERTLIESLIEGRSNISLLERTLSRREVDSLLVASDCFVSLHRAEGFGLAIAEAMALGKPVVATYWSGNVDFMTPWNSAPVTYELRTLEESYGPYRAGQMWADPDIEDAARWMRELANDRERAAELGRRAAIDIESGFSTEAVGRLAVDRLSAIRRRRTVRAA